MATKKLTEEEIAVREVVDSLKEIIREGLADKHLVDIYNVVNNRCQIVIKRDGGNPGTQKVTSGGAVAKSTSGVTTARRPRKTATTEETPKRAPRRTRREKLFSVLRSSRLKDATVKVLGVSEKDDAKSLVEVVTGNQYYEVGKKIAVKTDNLTEVK